MKHKENSKFRLIFKTIAIMLLQAFLFTNFAWGSAAEFIKPSDGFLSMVSRANLSPAIGLRDIAVKGLFTSSDLILGVNSNIKEVFGQYPELYNVQFMNDAAENPTLMSHISIDDFKKAMLFVLNGKDNQLKVAYLKHLGNGIKLETGNRNDQLIIESIVRIIAVDSAIPKTIIKAVKSLSDIAIATPVLSEQLQTKMIDAVNTRMDSFSKKNRSFPFIYFQALESLTNMNASNVVISRLNVADVDLTQAASLLRNRLNLIVNYINRDMQKKGKSGRVARIKVKQNSFTDGLWLYGSDIDGLEIYVENMTRAELSGYIQIAELVLMEFGVAGIERGFNGHAEIYWELSTSEELKRDEKSEKIVLYDAYRFKDNQSDSSLWSPLKKGWNAKKDNFRTDKSKLRRLFIDMLGDAQEAGRSVENFLFDHEAVLKPEDKLKIMELFNDPVKNAQLKSLLNRAHVLLAVNEVFLDYHGQAQMLVDDVAETIDMFRLLEKIADNASDQLVRVREIPLGNGKMEIHVYPLWFMYTKGARGDSDQGIRIIGRESLLLASVDDNLLFFSGGDSAPRVASISEVQEFITKGNERKGIYDLANNAMMLVDSQVSFSELKDSNQNYRELFFDKNGNITILANSEQESEKFINTISRMKVLESVVDRNNGLYLTDIFNHNDKSTLIKFSEVFENLKVADVDNSIKFLESAYDPDLNTIRDSTSEELADFVDSGKNIGKEAIFDFKNNEIILVQEGSVYQMVQEKADYRWCFFDRGGDITILVNNQSEADKFIALIKKSKSLAEQIGIQNKNKLIIKDSESTEVLKEISFFEIIGKLLLDNKEKPSGDFRESSPQIVVTSDARLNMELKVNDFFEQAI